MDLKNKFDAAWWLRNPHAQTIWPTFFRRPIELVEKWERVELSDGDFLDLVWDDIALKQKNRPIVVLLHGLGGSIQSTYAKGLMAAITKKGFCPVLMHFRGSSGIPNRLPRSYHSGDTEDLAFIIDRIKTSHPNTPVAVVGISLGGNVLLKWLGQTQSKNPLHAAVAVSVPFELAVVANRFMRGFSQIYQWWLLRKLIMDTKIKFQTMECPFDIQQVHSIKSFWQFDDIITSRLHGFRDVYDYYQRSSCRQYLEDIEIPTLIIHSRDDPFMTADIVPEPFHIGKEVQLEISETGGHVGFIKGNIPGNPFYWLEEKIPNFLSQYL